MSLKSPLTTAVPAKLGAALVSLSSDMIPAEGLIGLDVTGSHCNNREKEKINQE